MGNFPIQYYLILFSVVWTPFNGRCGQFKTSEMVAYTQDIDLATLEDPFVDGTGAVKYYDIMGNRHSAPVPGINIMIQPDGTARKVLVK